MLTITIIICFLILLAIGMPVNFALGSLGLVGLYFFRGGVDGLDSAAFVAWASANNFTLTAIPLFIFMGELIMRAGFSKDLFEAVRAWTGKLRGGLGLATIVACGIFSAVSGSSAAACATMGLLAIPEMERYGYNKRLIYGTLTSGGSLDILIPPSIILIVYGAFAEQSIAKLYLAGFIPGIILGFFFALVVYIWVRMYPADAPAVEATYTLRQKVAASTHASVFILLMIACLGTIYLGIATPTEAAGLGAVATFITALIMKRLTWDDIKLSLLSTVTVTCMVMFLILGGMIVSNFLMLQDVPRQIMEYTFSLNMPNWAILLVMYGIYAVMGCLLDGLTMLVVTLPIVVPMLSKMGMDLIWFGIVAVILVELSQLTPPVGMNLYIIRNVARAKIEDVIAGSMPFTIAIVACLILVTIFPEIVTYVVTLIDY